MQLVGSGVKLSAERIVVGRLQVLEFQGISGMRRRCHLLESKIPFDQELVVFE